MSTAAISIVIICYNAADTITRTLQSAALLSDDIILIDTGSNDGTQALVKSFGVNLLEMPWGGFGTTKNRGNERATHDWVLSLDADEELSESLIASIKSLDLTDDRKVYRLERLNYLNGHPIRRGAWKNDWTTRLFNRTTVRWDDSPVHEQLILPEDTKVCRVPGLLYHYTAANIKVYNEKLDRYASLMAEKYHQSGVQGFRYKTIFSPAISFLKSYIFQLGVLDRKRGWQIALAHARYTYKKYQRLKALVQKEKPIKKQTL